LGIALGLIAVANRTLGGRFFAGRS
jgi:hypothetical protein